MSFTFKSTQNGCTNLGIKISKVLWWNYYVPETADPSTLEIGFENLSTSIFSGSDADVIYENMLMYLD